MLRRLGIERESGYAETDTGYASGVDKEYVSIREYFWDNPGGDLSKEFAVIQTGTKLYFMDSSTSAPSASVIPAGGLDLTAQPAITEALSGQCPISFASISGYLIIACAELSTPYEIYYNKADSSFTVGKIYPKVRDVWGVDDGLDVAERPSTLSDAHYWNIFNQGWGELEPRKISVVVSGAFGRALEREEITVDSVNTVKIDQVFSDRGTYPSNAEIQNLYADKIVDSTRTNSSPAPKGRFVIEAFRRGGSRQELLEKSGSPLVLPDDAEQGRISIVQSYADRVFYSGVVSDIQEGDLKSPDFGSVVFFSEQFKSKESFGKCHQEADPTSEDFSELVATDGGFISIVEANDILAMQQFGNFLLVFASNGVWAITGPDGVFAADNYQVTKITSTGAISSSSIVTAENSVMYWSHEGVYAITPSEIKDSLQVQPVIETTIQTFYNNIPSAGKLHAKGIYDRVERRLRWLYNDDSAYDGVTDKEKYNKELVFDATLGAWYPYDFGTAWIRGYIRTSPYASVLSVQDVVYNGDPVQYNGDQVTYTTSERASAVSTTKYLLEGYDAVADGSGNPSTLHLTVGTLSEASFLDWVGNSYINAQGVDAAATALASWTTGGDVTRRKDIEYLHLFFRRTETGVDGDGNPIDPSGCQYRVRWDFADSSNSGKFSPQRQGYRYKRMFTVPVDGLLDYGQEVLVTKNRVRGSGKSLAIEINSEPGKDLHMHGYAVTLLGNQEE
jgi:hypothetical protein